jgi:uncharacterized membrane protein
MDRPVLSKYEGHLLSRPGCSKFAMWFQTRLEQQPDETLAELVQRELQEGLIPFKLAQYFNTTQVFRLSEMVISDSAAAQYRSNDVICTVDGRCSVCHSCDRMSRT